MQLTNNEIVFLTSVSRGKVPFGVSYKMPPEGKKEEFVEETLQSLMKKGILNEERKLTKDGAAIIRFWELYRNNSRHVTVNQVKTAVVGKGKLITVYKQGDVYDVNCMDSTTMMYLLLNQSKYLCQGEDKPERGKWQSMNQEEWEREMENIEGCIPIAEYENGKLLGRKVFYWKENQGYLMNLERFRVRRLSPAVMRKQIFKMIGGEEYERYSE